MKRGNVRKKHCHAARVIHFSSRSLCCTEVLFKRIGISFHLSQVCRCQILVFIYKFTWEFFELQTKKTKKSPTYHYKACTTSIVNQRSMKVCDQQGTSYLVSHQSPPPPDASNNTTCTFIRGFNPWVTSSVLKFTF